jgi:MFS family permease
MNAPSLLGHRDFVKLWSAQTISVFGSLITHTALPFAAVIVLDAGPIELGALMAAAIMPGLIFGLVAGVWVDRIRRRPIMIWADIGRALVLCTVPIAYAFDALTMAQLLAVAFAAGSLTIVFDVAYLAYLPSLVTREQLLDGNSKTAATASVSEVVAFSSAGWLVQLLSGPAAVLIDSVTFLVSAAFLGAIRTPEPEPKPAADRAGMATEAREGIRAIMHDPVLRTIAGTNVVCDFSFRMFGAVFMVYVINTLGFEPGVLGVIFAVGGISSLGGALLAGRAARRFGLGPSMALGVALMGASMLFVPAATNASLLAVAFLVAQQVLGDGAYTVYDVNQVTLRQSITADETMGRVNAGIRISSMWAMLSGAIAGGILGEVAGVRATLVLSAAGLIVAAGWLVVSPVFPLRDTPMHEVKTNPPVGQIST